MSDHRSLALATVAGVGIGAVAAALALGHSPFGAQAKPAAADARRSRSRFRAHDGASTMVVGCASNGEYFSCIDHVVREGDSVVVIRGTTDGTVSKEDDADGGRARAEGCAGAAGGVVVFEGDVWDVRALQALSAASAAGPFSVLCLETSNLYGNDMLCDAMALVRMLRSVLAPTLRTLIVKSRAMAMHGRCFHDSRRVLALPPAQLRKVVGGGAGARAHVLGAIGVSDYRDTLALAVRGGSRVLEIGTAVGTTAFLMAEAAGEAGRVVGIDIGKLCIKRAQAAQRKRGGLSARIHFEVADAWDMAALLRLDAAFDAIYIDVGGLSGADGEFEALALVRMLCCTFAKSLRFVVIKSRCLRHHASEFTHAAAVLAEAAPAK